MKKGILEADIKSYSKAGLHIVTIACMDVMVAGEIIAFCEQKVPENEIN